MKKSILFKAFLLSALVLPTIVASCGKDDDPQPEPEPEPVPEDTTSKDTVIPTIPVESVELNIHDTTIFVGENIQFNVKVLPTDADTQDVVWSGDEDILIVSKNGAAAGKSAGTAYLYVTSVSGGHKDSCKIVVRKNIEFADANLLAILKSNSDVNLDGDEGISPSEAEAVKTLDISDKKIANFNEINYFINLEELTCSNNQIESLDLSGLKNLKTLRCQNNKLSELLISNNSNLVTLICNKNNLETLDIRDNEKLEDLFCGNQSSTLNLKVTIEQFNTLWKENGTDTDNKNVAIVMDIFENALFHSDSFEKDLKNEDSFSFNSKKGQFSFRLYNKNGEELSFYDETVLKQIVWSSSDENIATVSADYESSGDDNTAKMTVKALSAGKTTIKGVVNNEFSISFNLEVK